ncbi:MAG: hypothetical protein JEY99_04495 [Spirochaetales bacterium]|nr:hypothetical protein [Spirochaetales bacterium]
MKLSGIGLVKRIIFIFFLVIGIIIAISGIVSGEFFGGLLMGAAVFIIPVFLINYLFSVFAAVFGKKRETPSSDEENQATDSQSGGSSE